MSITAKYIPEAFRILAQWNALLAEKTAPDPDYTDEANARNAESWTRQIKEQYTKDIAPLHANAELRAVQAKAAAAKHQAYDLTDTAVLMRSEQAWAHIVKPALEKGASLSAVLAGADTDAVAAAQRFASPWLQRNGKDASGVGLAVAARLADLAPTAKAAAEIRAGGTADAELASFRTIVELAERGDSSGAARAAQHALGEGTRFHYDGQGKLTGITPPAEADDAA